MLQTEFERLTNKPFTEEQFEKIHFVYCYYPGADTHAAIAKLWSIGGIRLIEDMLPTAKRIAEAERKMRQARTAYEEARDQWRAACQGGDVS